MRKIIPTILSIIFLAAIVSAYNGWNYGYLSPSNLLDNEWVVFGLIFIVFFAIIFFALGKTFKENKAISAIVAVALSFFISVIFSRRVSFYGYVGEEVTGWITLIALLIIIVFFLKAMFDLLRVTGLVMGIIGTWLFLHFFDLEPILGYNVIENPIFYYAQGWLGALIAGIACFLIIANREKIKGKTQWEKMWTSH